MIVGCISGESRTLPGSTIQNPRFLTESGVLSFWASARLKARSFRRQAEDVAAPSGQLPGTAKCVPERCIELAMRHSGPLPAGRDTERLRALPVMIRAGGVPIRTAVRFPRRLRSVRPSHRRNRFPNKTRPEDAFASSGLAKETSVRN